MLKRLEEIVTCYNEEIYKEPRYSLTANDRKAIVLGFKGDICNGMLMEIVALAFAYNARVDVSAHDGKPFLEIQLY